MKNFLTKEKVIPALKAGIYTTIIMFGIFLYFYKLTLGTENTKYEDCQKHIISEEILACLNSPSIRNEFFDNAFLVYIFGIPSFFIFKHFYKKFKEGGKEND